MKVLIVGCGRVGSRLALRLERSGHGVTVIDEDREAFSRLGGSFLGPTYQGSGLDKSTLKKGINGGVDMVVAITGGDNRNLMIAQMARHQFNIEKVVARLKDPVRAAKYREMGIETLCTTTVVEGLLELWVNEGEFPTLPAPISPSGDCSALTE